MVLSLHAWFHLLGERTPDVRLGHYVQPEWVHDPFGGCDAQPRVPVFGENYVAVVPLSEAARGKVWLGLDLNRHRKVVLKQHHSAPNSFPLAHERDFLIELDGGKFPKVIDYFVSDNDSTETLVLDDLDALTLQEWRNKNEFDLSDVRQITLQIVDALEQMHRLQIAHRDIKTTNILLRSPQDVFLIDLLVSLRLQQLFLLLL